MALCVHLTVAYSVTVVSPVVSVGSTFGSVLMVDMRRTTPDLTYWLYTERRLHDTCRLGADEHRDELFVIDTAMMSDTHDNTTQFKKSQ